MEVTRQSVIYNLRYLYLPFITYLIKTEKLNTAKFNLETKQNNITSRILAEMLGQPYKINN